MANTISPEVSKMLRVKRLGLVRTETDYLHALLDAMADMDRSAEVEVLKSLGDVNLEKGRLGKDVVKLDRARVLYRTALLRCEDADIRESLEYRNLYVEKLRVRAEKGSISSVSKGPSLARVAEKFALLDRKLAADYNKDALLIEYTKLMIEGIVNEDNMLEVEAIKSLGDVFLKRGRENRDAPCLTKASALYNTALARCQGVQDSRVALIHRLLYTSRIRQGMRKTGNKSPKHSGHLNRSHHLSRDLLGTSRSSDAIAGTKCQQFRTPSAAYIASQKPRRSTPDYRLYKEHLTTGDHALTDGKLDLAERKFASALKLIHDPNEPDRPKEADCLSRLGDVYVQTGKSTKDGRKFTQAAALYNAAMVRTKSNKHKVMKSLHDTEQSFLLHTANVDSKPSPPDSARRHQKRLGDMRARVKSTLDSIDQQHNPYQYDEEDPAIITVEAERAEAVKALCKTIAKDRQLFIKDLVDECIGTLGPPPCKYAFIGLGSQATELVTPYSDLEFAILIEDGKDNDDTRRYFLNLTHYLNLKVINLGETILPAMAIPSLNDFQSGGPEKDWFFDSVTPHGFAFDGFMPWASKTPFGRDETKTKPPVSLIQTPAEMTKFQQREVSLSEGYHLSDILKRVVFLAGEVALVNEYMDLLKLMNSTTDHLLSSLQSRQSAMQILLENMDQVCSHEPTGQLLNVKKDIYRFPGIGVEILAQCCNIALASAWSVIDKLMEMGHIQEENASHLTVLTSISAELRLRTYMANGGQKDSLSPLAKVHVCQTRMDDVAHTTLKSEFHIPDTTVLFRYYCRAIPLKKCITGTILDRVKQGLVFKTALFDSSNECKGRIAANLLLFDKAIHHLEAAIRDAGSDMKRSQLHNELGLSWAARGDQKKAISHYQESVKLSTTVHGNHTHPDTVKSLHNLGLAKSKLGDYGAAINCYEKALEMIKTVSGDNIAHGDTAACLNSLGSFWRKLGDFEKAIMYYKQFLTMTESLIGNNETHPDIAGALNNLGICCHELGNHKEAIRYLQKSLTMMKAIYGDITAHPDIAMSLDNLGSAWRELGNQEKAINYSEQSLTILKTIYGETHPNIARSLLNLGSSWLKQGNEAKAIEYCQQSLTMRKCIFGDNTPHLDIAKSLLNLGSCLKASGDPTKAINYFEQTIRMIKTKLGESTAHPDIATSLHSLGLCWSALGDEQRAIRYYESSLTMTKAIYESSIAHPSIAKVLNSLGLSWSNRGNQKRAISYYEQSLMMTKTIYGENTVHPDIAESLIYLGLSWQKLLNLTKAIGYYEQFLTMMRTLHGENKAYSNIAGALDGLGMCWCLNGNLENAVSYFKQSLTMWKTIYGDNTAHMAIAKSLHCLGLCWALFGDQKNTKKAIRYFEQALTMKQTIFGIGDSTAHPELARLLNDLRRARSALGNMQ